MKSRIRATVDLYNSGVIFGALRVPLKHCASLSYYAARCSGAGFFLGLLAASIVSVGFVAGRLGLV